ncbi:MAG: alpha/beta fold hydrolase [Solirubrobacterales bacterium]|nr:alpha/beta fold hydrolase [Solirubrobacterales bacterium]
MTLRFRTAVAITIAALGLVALAQAGGAEAKVRKGPGKLAFYKPPQKLPKHHGKLIWARNAKGVVPLAEAASTKLVLYSSITPQGKRTAVSGSVSVPEGKAPKGGWPVISYGHGTTGIADVCAPSRNTEGGPAQGYIDYIDPQLNDWLDAGYAVVRSDYQGLGTPGTHPFLVGKAEGRSMLDIVRAAHQLNPGIGKRFLLAGHSQGGQSALFAASLAKTWVPDLKLRGTVSYAPGSHLLLQAQALPGFVIPSSLSALATLVVKGAATTSKQIKPAELLSDPPLLFFPQVDKTCLPQLGAADKLGGIAPSTLLRNGADTTALYSALDAMNPAVETAPPIFLAQGDADTTAYPALTDALNVELLGLGDDVTYTVYPGIDHGGVVSAAGDDALAFFQERLPAG